MKRNKRSSAQIFFIIISVVLLISMLMGFVIMILPGAF